MQYVILSADTTRVDVVFSGPQDAGDKPHYAEIADDDPRITAFATRQSALTTLIGKINEGIAITCTGNAALNATYALDDTTMSQIGDVARDSAAGMGFPMGASTFDYPDITGTQRTFTETQLVALYKAQRNMLFQLNTQASIMARGDAPTWPTQSATIA